MGISYTAMLIVGVPADELYKQKSIENKKEKTKYNSDTGEPYKVEYTETDTSYYWLGQKTDEDVDVLAESVELEYILGSYPTGEDPIIGLGLGKLDRYNSKSIMEFTIGDIQDKLNQVNSILKSLGISTKAKVYLMNQCS